MRPARRLRSAQQGPPGRPTVVAALIASAKGFAFGAAGAALVCASVLAIGLITRAVPAGLSFQPSGKPTPPGEFVRPTNEHPAATLAFFAADSALLIGYLLSFVGLRAATASSAPRVGGAGLAVGLVMAGADAIENGVYATYAIQALRGIPLTQPNTGLLYAVTGLKEVAAGAAFLLFSLALWRTGRAGGLGRLIAGLLLLAPIVGLLSLLLPALIGLRGWTICAPMPFLAVWLWRQTLPHQFRG